MSLITIKRKNKEFAKWWNRWVSQTRSNEVSTNRSETNEVSTNGSETTKTPNPKVRELPHAIKILRRYPRT